MSITITAFESSPDRGRGLARDMRVRWALEEVGQPYNVRLLSFKAMKEPAHLALHPFGQIPTYQDENIELFESGVIVLHIAERHSGLLPTEPGCRMRAIMWMFAALNSVEPPVVERDNVEYSGNGTGGLDERLAVADDRIRKQLHGLSSHLADAAWLESGFSAGDLMMVHVLQRLKGVGLLEEFPNLAAYVARAEARPAFQRAFAAQLAVFTSKIAAGNSATLP